MDNGIPVSPRTHADNVSELQDYLRGIAYGGWDIPLILTDGIYGEETRIAVEKLQKLLGLPVTGEVDADTWNSIYNLYVDIEDNLFSQEGITPFPSFETIIGINDKGTVILILQAMINTLASEYYNIPYLTVNGVYDTATAQAVSELQRIFGIDITGLTDIRTWNMLVRTFNADNEYLT